MTFEGLEPAGIALHVCIQRRKPKLVQPCPCCILGVSVEQVTGTAAGFCLGKSCFAPEESLGASQHFSTVGDDGKKDLWARLLDGVGIESSASGIYCMNSWDPQKCLAWHC